MKKKNEQNNVVASYSNDIKNTVQRRSDQIKDLQFIRKDIY